MNPLRRSRTRGSVLVGVLIFALVLSVMLAGVSTFTVSHRTRAMSDANYAAALDMAESGVNYELNKISANTSNADASPGTSTTLGNGTFKVYCTNRDGSTPWVAPNDLYVISTGKVNGVSRTIKVSAKGMGTSPDYALYGNIQVNLNGNINIDGSVGTNGQTNINGSVNITGSVVLNGSGASANINPAGLYTPVKKPNPVVWPTVDQIANGLFPSGGLTWLATHNDNALATPAPVGNQININGNGDITFKGKAGGANYYLTALNMNGNGKVLLDNTAGPITLWFGPAGSWASFSLNGGHASVSMTSDSSKACKIYVGSWGNINLNGNNEVDAGLYAYNGTTGGQINFNGNGNIYGSAICNQANFNGAPNIHYTPGYFNAGTGGSYYGFDSSWKEIGGR